MPGLDDIKRYRARIAELGELLQELSSNNPGVDPVCQAKTRDIVQIVLEVHGEVLSTVIQELADAGDTGQAVLSSLTKNELVASLLLLHGLHPTDFKTRVMQALDKARPTLHNHGGDVELLDVSDGIVRLKLQGSCHGCPSSSETLRHAIEEALYESAPDMVAIEVEGLAEETAEEHPPISSGLVQLTARGTALSA